MPFDGGCNTPAIVDRMGGPRCLSGYTSLVDIDNIDGNYVFAFFVIFFLSFDLLFCPFSLPFAAFWRRKLPIQRYCNILEFELRTSHFLLRLHNFVLKLLMLDGISTNFPTRFQYVSVRVA